MYVGGNAPEIFHHEMVRHRVGLIGGLSRTPSVPIRGFLVQPKSVCNMVVEPACLWDSQWCINSPRFFQPQHSRRIKLEKDWERLRQRKKSWDWSAANAMQWITMALEEQIRLLGLLILNVSGWARETVSISGHMKSFNLWYKLQLKQCVLNMFPFQRCGSWNWCQMSGLAADGTCGECDIKTAPNYDISTISQPWYLNRDIPTMISPRWYQNLLMISLKWHKTVLMEFLNNSSWMALTYYRGDELWRWGVSVA